MIRYKPPLDEHYGMFIQRLFPEQKNGIVHLTIQVTENCNMACTYCYQHNKTNNRMTFNTAKIFIDKLLNDEFKLVNTLNADGVAIEFIGGEPFLEIDLIDNICNYFLTTMIKLNHPWLYFTRFAICSNGLLYNTIKVQKFFRKYNAFISFTVSLDGDKQLHDSCRIDLQGNGTYDRILKNIKHYSHYYNTDNMPNTKLTISYENLPYLFNGVISLIENNYHIIHLNCVFEDVWNYSTASLLYTEMKKISNYLIEHNLYDRITISLYEESFFVQKYDEDNANWCGGVADTSMAINYKGNMYPCIRYMDSSLNNKQKALNIGNIYTGYLITEEEKENYNLISNITRRSQSTDECYYCPIGEGCSWCSAYNYEEFGTPNKRATYICCMHKARSLANVYYWNTLYKYLNIDKKFTMHLPKEEALKIIDEQEYNYLLNLSQE